MRETNLQWRESRVQILFAGALKSISTRTGFNDFLIHIYVTVYTEGSVYVGVSLLNRFTVASRWVETY